MRRASLISPLVAFPAIWVLGVALAQIHVLEFQTSWSAVAWAVMISVPIAFVIGGVAAGEAVRRLVPARGRGRKTLKSSRALRLALVACLVLGYLELAHQWIAGDGIPLFSDSVDEVRFRAPGGPPVLLTDLLTVAVIVALTVPRSLLARESRFEVGVAVIALLGFALNGGRVTIVFPLVAVMVARTLYWGPPPRRLVIAAGVLMAGFVAAVFYLRSSQHTGAVFESELYGSVLPGTPFLLEPLVPLHIGLTTNFEALAQVVDYFPQDEAFAGGAFNAHGADLFIGDARELGEVTQTLTAPWVSATVAGTLWADGGYALVVLGVAITGAISTAGYAYARLRPASLAAAMVAGVLFYHAIFNFYTNLWTQHLDWLLICPLLVVMATIARDPEWPSHVLERIRLLGRRYAVGVAGKADTKRPPGAAQKLWARARSGPWPLVGLGVAVLAVTAFIVDRTAPDSVVSSVSTLQVEESREFAQGEGADLRNTLATNSDLEVDNEPLWSVERQGDVALVRAFSFATSGDLEASRESRVQLEPGFTSPVFDVATVRNGPGLYAIQSQPGGAEVQIVALEPGAGRTPEGLEKPNPVASPQTVATTSVELPAPDPRGHRDFAVATWSGSEPDLFVIDRGVPINRVAVTILSGESDFAQEIGVFKLPLAGLSPKEWDIDLGTVSPGRLDLVMYDRSETGSGRPEVHVLTGETGFALFALQRAIDLPEQLPPGYRLLIGSSLGAPTVYGVDGQADDPAIDLVPLAVRAISS